MRSLTAPDESSAQQRFCQIARLLAAGVLRLHKCGTCLAALSRSRAQATPESGRQGLDLSGAPRLSVRAG